MQNKNYLLENKATLLVCKKKSCKMTAIVAPRSGKEFLIPNLYV